MEMKSGIKSGKVGILQFPPYEYGERVVVWTTQLETVLTCTHPQFIPIYTITTTLYLINNSASDTS